MNYLALTLFILCFILYGFIIARKINYIRVVDQNLIVISLIGIGNYFYYKKIPLIWQLVFLFSLVAMRFLWITFYGDRGSIYLYNASKLNKGVNSLIKKHAKHIELSMKYKNQISYQITTDKKALKVFLNDLNEYIANNGKSSLNEYTVIILFVILFIAMFL